MTKTILILAIAAAFVAGTITTTGLVYAHGGSVNLIHACVDKTLGTLRIVGPNTTCKQTENPLDWNFKDALRKYNANPPYNAGPCNTLNPSTSTVSYLFRDKAAITDLGFDPIIGNLPIFAEASAEPFIGELELFAGNFAPRGYAFAQGQLLPISQNTALFALLGTTYGGDGRTTFALPDMRCLESAIGPHYIIALQGIFPSQN